MVWPFLELGPNSQTLFGRTINITLGRKKISGAFMSCFNVRGLALLFKLIEVHMERRKASMKAPIVTVNISLARKEHQSLVGFLLNSFDVHGVVLRLCIWNCVYAKTTKFQ